LAYTAEQSADPRADDGIASTVIYQDKQGKYHHSTTAPKGTEAVPYKQNIAVAVYEDGRIYTAREVPKMAVGQTVRDCNDNTVNSGRQIWTGLVSHDTAYNSVFVLTTASTIKMVHLDEIEKLRWKGSSIGHGCTSFSQVTSETVAVEVEYESGHKAAFSIDEVEMEQWGTKGAYLRKDETVLNVRLLTKHQVKANKVNLKHRRA
jgi:hypothetical protein